MSTVRYKVMQKKARDANRRGEIIKKDTELVPSLLTIKKKEKLGGVNISEADVIVSGGRGLKKAEDFSPHKIQIRQDCSRADVQRKECTIQVSSVNRQTHGFVA